MAQKTTRSKAGKGKKADRHVSERYQKALDGLERAVKFLFKGDPGRAKEQLEKLQESYSEERELMDRVRSYLQMCEKQLSPQKRPKTAEEMVNAGVISLNEDDAPQAIKHLTKALDLEPKNAYVQYCLAAAYAETGDAAAAAEHLKPAITADPAARVTARADESFSSVRESAELAPLLAEA